jgi:rubrerythrin
MEAEMGCENLDTIKGAILIEKRGVAFYASSAAATKSEAVARLFRTLSEEETKHQAWLEKLFVEMSIEGRTSGITPGTHDPISPEIFTEAIRNEIGAASYEASAISAAMALEQRSADYYRKGAEGSGDPECRRLFTILADWEVTHLELLARIDRDLQQSIWFDNAFWPSI